MSEKFLIDTNSFITPDKTYYAPDIAPSYWLKFAKVLSEKQEEVAVLDLVANELQQGNDTLKEWFQDLADKGDVKIISRADNAILDCYGQVMQHIADSPLYREAAIRNWGREGLADPWLIAAAMAYGYTIVTFEKSPGPINPNSPSRNPKIPVVAKQFDVKCENLFYFMRYYGIKL